MSRPRSLLALASLVAIALSGATPALAGQLVPVPTVVIYPGDIIRDGMLTEREMPDDFAGLSAAVLDRSALINKTSRRTLLPNLPIARTSVGEPKVVTLGASVRIVYSDGGLTISTYGSALEAGAVGDVIPVRTREGGATISGRVESDGAVHISQDAGRG